MIASEMESPLARPPVNDHPLSRGTIVKSLLTGKLGWEVWPEAWGAVAGRHLAGGSERRETVIYWAFSPSILYKSGAAHRWQRGPVAQGIEQQPSKLKVAGSNPAGVAIIVLISFSNY